MIVYLASKAHRYPLLAYLETLGRAVSPRIAIVDYERMLARRAAPAATYIFADLERLSPAESERAGLLWRTLAADGRSRLLNDPLRAMRRYELLRALHADGVNPFTAYRAVERPRPASFPVFLRAEGDHAGPLSPLLHAQPELDDALDALAAAGHCGEDKLVVEFVDVADVRGLYHMYSAYRAGPCIVASDHDFSRDWVAKPAGPESRAPASHDAEVAYVRDNPHAGLLMPLFERARIEYGRIDYALKDGRICVFEINTNPTVLDPTWADPSWVAARRIFAAAFTEALAALDTVVPGRPVALPAELRRVDRSYRARLAVRAALSSAGLSALELPILRTVRRVRAALPRAARKP